MLGLKDNTTENQEPTSKFPPTPSAAESSKLPLLARAGRWRPALLGLDIGSTTIKAVLLHRPYGRITLKQAAIAPTPRDAVTDGTLTGGIEVASQLSRLFTDFRIRARQVAVAAGGDKVYCQCDSVSNKDGLGLEEMVRRAAAKAPPFPVENALLDYQPVGADLDGASLEVLWVSTAVEQVEWLRETVVLAGKNPALVDVQACALANAFAPQPRTGRELTLRSVTRRRPPPDRLSHARANAPLCPTCSRRQAPNDPWAEQFVRARYCPSGRVLAAAYPDGGSGSLAVYLPLRRGSWQQLARRSPSSAIGSSSAQARSDEEHLLFSEQRRR